MSQLFIGKDIGLDRGHHKYFLDVWNDGSFYTGTLIDLIYEILNKSEDPIPQEKLYDRIKPFFPNTSFDSLKSMLIYGLDNRFVRFEDYYYGIVGRKYKMSYVYANISKKYSFEERFKCLEEFIEREKRFPNLSIDSSKEERSLWRWLNYVISEGPNLSDNQKEKIEKIISEYHFLPKKSTQVRFVEQCDAFLNFVRCNKRMPLRSEKPDLWDWFKNASVPNFTNDNFKKETFRKLLDDISKIIGDDKTF